MHGTPARKSENRGQASINAIWLARPVTIFGRLLSSAKSKLPSSICPKFLYPFIISRSCLRHHSVLLKGHYINKKMHKITPKSQKQFKCQKWLTSDGCNEQPWVTHAQIRILFQFVPIFTLWNIHVIRCSKFVCSYVSTVQVLIINLFYKDLFYKGIN